MSKTTVYEIRVAFGDCDPAGIVFFPNFLKWMDASSLHFFMECGVPPWRELERLTGILGDPLLEINTRFLSPATYGDTLQITTSIQEWSGKVFTQKHVIKRGDTVICEGTEKRAFCMRVAGEGHRIKAVAIPEDIRRLCS
jgi:4-hydroxybenzoyl-CoA thioesterase